MARQRNAYSKDVKGRTFIKDRNGKLVTNREEVQKVWEGHYSELLNHEGNMSDLELPNYVHDKLNVIEITDMEVTRGLKGMKKGKAPGWDEMRTEMVDVAGEIGARWTKRLLNTCMKQCKVPEDWRTNCPHMETERRCIRPMEVQRNNSAESYYETTREDSGQEVA